jgi:hypothetical protein
MNISRLFSNILTAPSFKSDTLFENVVDHDNIKRLFGMALQSESWESLSFSFYHISTIYTASICNNVIASLAN